MRSGSIHWILVTVAAASLGGFAAADGNSLMSISRDGKRLLTANTDNGSITVVDLAEPKSVREIKVGAQPESVAWIGAGPKAIVALYRDDSVAIVDTEKGQVLQRIGTAVEPYGVVVDRAGARAWVTNEYPGHLTEIDLAAGKIRRTLPVGPFVRGIALAPDEKRLLVTHYYSGAVSAVAADSGKVVDYWPPSSEKDNLVRQIAIHPTLPLAYIAHIRSRTQRAEGASSIFPQLTVIDLVPKQGDKSRRHSMAMDEYNNVAVPCNPWENVVSPDGRRHYILYAGTNDVNISNVVNDDYTYVDRVKGLTTVGSNPRAVAVSPDSATVYIYNTLDFQVAVYQAESFRKIGDITVCERPYSAEMHRGKVLFNLARQPMSRRRWISCSSCHPDGDHDGRTWKNNEGLRRTTHFFGMSRTYPLHWSADRDELQDFEVTIRGPLMQGRGLIDGEVNPELGAPNAGRSKDLDALALYCNSLEPTLSPHAAGPGRLSPLAEKGRELFNSASTGCATCHSGRDYTDRKVHDVGTGGEDPAEKMGPKYDTPSLIRIYRNLSFLHHGGRATLREVLTNNPGDRHGKTGGLKPDELDALVEFMKSLPYEVPSASN